MSMSLSRRQFASRSILAATASAFTFSLTGCNAFSDILAWTAVASTAIDGIVTVLGPLMPPGGAAIITLIKAALADLAAAITQYNSDTNPADKATLLAKIRTFLEAIAANLQSFFQQITSAGPTINIALGLAEVVIAAVEGFLGTLPPAPTPAPAATQLHVGSGRTVPVTPKLYKRVSDFKRDFNAVCILNNRPELEIK